jgi:hypothetical protein
MGDSGDSGDTGDAGAAQTNTETPTLDTSGMETRPAVDGDAILVSPGADLSMSGQFWGAGVPLDSPAISMEIPNITWDITDAGVQMVLDGAPVDSTYGQLDPSGLFQIPIDPNDPGAGSILMWGEPLVDRANSLATPGPDGTPSDLEGILAGTEGIPDSISSGLDGFPPDFESSAPGSSGFSPGIDGLISELTQPIPSGVGEPIPGFEEPFPSMPPGFDLYSLPPGLGDPVSDLDQTMAEMPSGLDGYTDPTAQFEDLQPPLADPMELMYAQQFLSGSAVVTQTAVAGATMAAVHAAPHLLPHLWHEAVKIGSEKAVNKGTWKLLERQEDRMGPLDYEAIVDSQVKATYRTAQQQREEGGKSKVKDADRVKVANSPEAASADFFACLPPQHMECLATLRRLGYEKKLNEPERLKFFIEQADGNIEYAKAWIDQYAGSKSCT